MAQIQKQISPGESAIGFRGDFRIKAVAIDNPTGSWLQLFSENKVENWQIPPYTLGWLRTFTKEVIAVDVISVPGPASQLSTDFGDMILVTLSDQNVGSSDGHPFVTRGDQPEVAFGRVQLFAPNPLGNSTVTLFLNGSTTQRLRVYGCIFSILNNIRPNEAIFADIDENPITATSIAIASCVIDPNRQRHQVPAFQNWYDLAIGSEIICDVEGDATTIPGLTVNFEIPYSVI